MMEIAEMIEDYDFMSALELIKEFNLGK